MSNPQNITASGNGTACPSAIFHTTLGLEGNTDFMTCYAPYVTGVRGDVIRDKLYGCCGSSVVVVRDGLAQDSYHHCYYFCNGTQRRGIDDPYSPLQYQELWKCIGEGTADGYSVQCNPRVKNADNRAASATPDFGVLGLGLLVLLLMRMLR